MSYHILIPSVYGQFGDATILNSSVHPPDVQHVHLVLDSPPRDDLHTVFPCFFVSGRLGRLISEGGLTGVALADVQAEMNEQYLELHPGDPLPELFWLKVTGQAGASDFGINSDNALVVSDRALSLIRKFQLSECQIYDAQNAPTQDQITADLWARAKLVAEQLRNKQGGT